MVRRLLYLNGLAALAVILFHSAGWGFVAMFAWTPRYLPVMEPVFDQAGSFSYYVLRLIEQVASAAIPLFLFVSGYFLAFAVGKRPNLEAKQIGARVKALIIPYTLWTILAWALKLAEGNLFAPQQYLVMFLIGSSTPAYYYVPLLIQYYLLAPLLTPLARKYWVWLLLATWGISVCLAGGGNGRFPLRLAWCARLGGPTGHDTQMAFLVPALLGRAGHGCRFPFAHLQTLF